MNNNIKINSLFLLIIYIFSAQTFAADQIDLSAEIKPLEINIELCKKIYEKIKNKKQFILNTQTDLTPKKNTIKMYSLDSPIKKKLNPVITKRKCTRNLFNSDESNKEIIYKTIFHNNYEFESDKWAFFDPFSKDDYVLIDCDDKKWDNIVKEITINIAIENIQKKQFKIFIKTMIAEIHNNTSEIKSLLTYKENSDGFCCRHFSTLALPIFAKVLQDDSHHFAGKIHQLSSTEINHNWTPNLEHSWNIIMLGDKDEDEVSYSCWFLDIYNKCFAKICSKLDKSSVKIYKIINSKLIKDYVYKNDDMYNYIKNTFDTYILQNKEFSEKMELAAHKFIAKNKLF